jgi:Catalase
VFKWIDAAGRPSFVRYSWVPDEGERRMSLLEARKQTTDYLQQDLYDRLGRDPARPIRFTLELQIASRRTIDAGLLCDPTSVWPDDREPVQAGLLEVTALDPGPTGEAASGGELQPSPETDADVVRRRQIIERDPALEPFNPLRLTEGIEPPSLQGSEKRSCCDPILAFRPPVYDLSYRERTGAGPADR